MFAQPLRSSSPDLYHGKYAASLFASGEQGAWYDPSDLTTMFQDAAGTAPVTGVEQPVGRVLDKSGRGNHATQTTTASRPVLSARVNLLTKTEQFDDSNWTKVQASIVTNSAIAPNGTLTTDTFIPSSGIAFTGVDGRFVNATSVLRQAVSVAAAAYKYRLRVKDAGYDLVQLRVSEGSQLYGSNEATTILSLVDGEVVNFGGKGNLSVVTATCTRTSDGWCDITLTFTSGSAQTLYFGLWVCNSTAVTSDGIKGLHLWGADIRVANESALIPSYQRVNTATDYDTQGFPLYLRFDGVDDWLVTPSINFTATDKMTVFTADHSAWDGSLMAIAGLSSSAYGTNGTFWLTAYDWGFNAYPIVYLRGNLRGAAPYGNDQRTLGVRRLIRSIRMDIGKANSSEEVLVRVNGNAQALAGAPLDPSAGAGNFGNHQLYIGGLGSSFPFKGRLYGLIVRGAQTDNLHLTNVERYLANRSGVTL